MTLNVKRINIKDFKIRFYKIGSKIAFWKNFSFEKEHPWGVILMKHRHTIVWKQSYVIIVFLRHLETVDKIIL